MAQTADVLVIGGGVFGLSVAHACAAVGLRVTLAEAQRIGAGASGGIVGALCPHRAEHWRPFKQFQLDALTSLPGRMAALLDQTGTDPGYRQVGRVTPARDRDRAKSQVQAALTHWRGADCAVLDQVPAGLAGWVDPGAAPQGLIRDTLSARVAPRRYLAALAAALSSQVEIREGWRCLALDPRRGAARFAQGEISAAYIVLAAGAQSFLLAAPLVGQSVGAGVKGQAALLAAGADPALPVLQGEGVFVIAQDDGTVAVGSTSEPGCEDLTCDTRLDDLVTRARALCPALRGAAVVERWAGLRPWAHGPTPLVGPVPGAERLILATGGYKIGLALAHLVGDAVAAHVTGTAPAVPLPPDFGPARHAAGALAHRLATNPDLP